MHTYASLVSRSFQCSSSKLAMRKIVGTSEDLVSWINAYYVDLRFGRVLLRVGISGKGNLPYWKLG